jgi:hypothetical protein
MQRRDLVALIVRELHCSAMSRGETSSFVKGRKHIEWNPR